MSDTTDGDEQDNRNSIHHFDSPEIELKPRGCAAQTPPL